MTLDEGEKSKFGQDLDKGVTKVGGQERVVKKAVRKTNEAKQMAAQADVDRLKNDRILKANLKNNDENADDVDSDWESVEEDAPVIQLQELLGNMKIEDEDISDEEKKAQ